MSSSKQAPVSSVETAIKLTPYSLSPFPFGLQTQCHNFYNKFLLWFRTEWFLSHAHFQKEKCSALSGQLVKFPMSTVCCSEQLSQ